MIDPEKTREAELSAQIALHMETVVRVSGKRPNIALVACGALQKALVDSGVLTEVQCLEALEDLWSAEVQRIAVARG